MRGVNASLLLYAVKFLRVICHVAKCVLSILSVLLFVCVYLDIYGSCFVGVNHRTILALVYLLLAWKILKNLKKIFRKNFNSEFALNLTNIRVKYLSSMMSHQMYYIS